MKIDHLVSVGRANAPGRRARGEDGVVTVIFIALLAFMLVFITVEARALIRLHQEVNMLQQQQMQRLSDAQTAQTNSISTTATHE